MLNRFTNASILTLVTLHILQIFRVKSWKRRWFILNDNCLYYFEFTTDKEPRGIIPLENIRVRETADRSKQHCFELFAAGNEVIKACKTDSDGKVVEGKICTENLFLISNLWTDWLVSLIGFRDWSSSKFMANSFFHVLRQAHCIPYVCINRGRKRRVDQRYTTKHKSQSILRHVGCS